jgi:hypothetical protein
MKKPKRFKLTSNFEKEMVGNIWDYIGKVDGICITINLYFKDGKNIMGAGIAKEAKERYPGIDHDIAFTHDTFGMETIHIIKCDLSNPKKIGGTKIITFPTKPAWIRVNKSKSNVLPFYRTKPFVFSGKDIPGYMGYSDLRLIKKSAENLRYVLDALRGLWQRVLIPKPGCSNGGLQWDDVKAVLKEDGLYHLDQVTFISKE